MRYRIGYKQRDQWKYFDVVGILDVAMKEVEKLFNLGYSQVTIKLLKSEA